MDDLRFLGEVQVLTLAALAARLEFELPHEGDVDRRVLRASTLESAGPAELTFFDESADLEELQATLAAACFVQAQVAAHVPPGTVALVCERPREAFRRAAAVLHPSGPSVAGARTTIDGSACVDPHAALEQGVTIGAFAMVGPRVEIGARTIVGAASVIDVGVRIGRGCVIGPHVSISNALIGDGVVIHAGARIGIDGNECPSRLLGRVIVQDAVGIGANAIVERGSIRDTLIGDRATIAPLAVVRGETRVERVSRVGFSSATEMV